MHDGSIKLSAKISNQEQSIFKPTSWSVKIELINQLILADNVLISIVSEHGGGKSTFARVLSQSLDNQIDIIPFNAMPLFTKESLLMYVAHQLDEQLPPTLSAIISFCQDHEQKTVVVIDDAHNIPEPFLIEILLAIQMQSQKSYFHVCLVSNFSLVPALNKLSESFRDMIHTIELGPLNEEETKTYILERLPHEAAPVSEEELEHFYQLTEGNIVGINTQMGSYFKNKASPSNKNYLKWGGGAAVVLGLGLVYLMMGESQTSVNEVKPAVQVTAVKPPELHFEKIDLPLESEVAFYQSAAVRQDIEATSLKKIEVAPNEEDPQLDDDLVVMDKVVVIPQVNKSPEVVAKPVPVAAAVKPVAKVIAKVNKPQVKQLAINKAQFTVQVLASHKAQDLERFARLHNLKNTKVLTAKVQGKEWYVLTLGSYATRQQAKQAIVHLPASVAQLKPWVRPLSDLKASG